MKITKKGGVEESFLFWVIIGIVTLAVIFVLLFRAGLTKDETYDEQVCRLSVLARATAESQGAIQQAIPLKCKTKKICFALDSEQPCDEQFRGEKFTKIKLPNDEKKAIDLIEETSAQEMYACWSMMGEGRFDLANTLKKEFLGQVYNKVTGEPYKPICAICSRLAVDKNVPAEWANKINLNAYMKTHQIPNERQTYLQKFTNGETSFAKVSDDSLNYLKENLNAQTNPEGTESNEIATIDNNPTTINRQMTFVFTQIKSTTPGTVIANQIKLAGGTVGVAGATTLITPVGGKIVTKGGSWILGAARGKVGLYLAGIAAVGAVAIGGYGAWNAHQGQLAAAAYCGEFTTKDSEKQGCSLVQGMNYNVEDINNLCGENILSYDE